MDPSVPAEDTRPRPPLFLITTVSFGAAALMAVINTVLWMGSFGGSPWNKLLPLFVIVAVLQTGAGAVAAGAGMWFAFSKHAKGWEALLSGSLALLGAMGAIGGVVGGFLGALFWNLNLGGLGGAWGRPLRVKGRQLHPELREGADWTEGDRPDASGLDVPTRKALEALWLHDAQKEHASVPAFSRVSWLLAAVGAPPSLVEGAHRAALEEAEHTKLCFALAAGYGGRTHTVEPMPELLLSGLGATKDPFEVLGVESLEDGCLLEDFNADVAARCAEVCREPVTKKVLLQIAKEERAHAELSWAILAFAVERRGEKLRPALLSALARLDRYPRPTAASALVAPLVAAADADALLAHGRLPDAEWAAAWEKRLTATRARARRLLDRDLRRAA